MSTKKFDKLSWGLIPSLLLPLVILLISWVVKSDTGFFHFISQFQRMGMLSKMVSLSVIPNLLLFFIYIWTNRNLSARGVVFGTMLWALVMLGLKFL
jgi:hypothetical protein